MYGLIGKMRAARGQRDAVMDVLLASTGALPGCLSYIIASDPADADAIWVTEVWTDQPKATRPRCSLPEVQAAIAKARPIIAGFEFQVETQPAGGFGLPAGKAG